MGVPFGVAFGDSLREGAAGEAVSGEGALGDGSFDEATGDASFGDVLFGEVRSFDRIVAGCLARTATGAVTERSGCGG